MGKETSIVTEFTEISAFSGAPAECRHHCIYGRGLRELAEEDHLWIPLTNREHNMSTYGLIFQIHENPAAEKLSKMVGQLAWEKEFYRNLLKLHEDHDADIARERFRARYGISYL